MQVERRRHRRFQVKDNAFTVLNPDPVKLVPIMDIGMGGLGIYVNEEDGWLNKSSKLEIMVADCSFYLENLSFNIVSTIRPFPVQSASLLDGRRYSIKFGNLRPGQKSSLKYFIRTYTEGGLIFQFLQKFSKFLHPIWTNKYSRKSCNTRIWHSLHHPSL